MPARGLIYRKIKLFAASSALFLTMCTFYDQGGAVVSSNGLSCQNQKDFGVFKSQQSAYCYYQCPDGTARQPEIPGKFSPSSPLYSASKEDLDRQFCSSDPQPTQTQPPATVSPTTAPSPTEKASPSPLAETSVTVQPPLLTGDVTMCDLAVDLISFRIIEPIPDLTGRALAVQIADQETACTVNSVNPSLLTCTIPVSAIFPVRVVVRLDDAVVNDFTYDGSWCANIATPLPSVTP